MIYLDLSLSTYHLVSSSSIHLCVIYLSFIQLCLCLSLSLQAEFISLPLGSKTSLINPDPALQQRHSHQAVGKSSFVLKHSVGDSPDHRPHSARMSPLPATIWRGRQLASKLHTVEVRRIWGERGSVGKVVGVSHSASRKHNYISLFPWQHWAII